MMSFFSSKPRSAASSKPTTPSASQEENVTPPSTADRFPDTAATLPSRLVTPKPNLLDNRDPKLGHEYLATPTTSPPGTPPHLIPVSDLGTKVPQGKLILKIIQARNLPSNPPEAEPYVICTFESNEFISRGPIPTPINGIEIPSSRQSSNSSLSELNKKSHSITTRQCPRNPVWNHEAQFDVLDLDSDIDLCIYDRGNSETFLGHVRIKPVLRHNQINDRWYNLEPLNVNAPGIPGEIKLQMVYERKTSLGPDHFELLRLIGRGTFGQVYQVRKKDTGRIYAMKILSKRVIVQKKEIAHTIGERNILVRTATSQSPFIIGLKFSFQTPTDLYLVTDYMSGGELFWHLQREGKFTEERAKFYIAELVLALEHLHKQNIVYRDLKPENILLDANGHVALCDFGLSKANLTANSTTTTFCGTTEYLAPEVLMDESGYTKLVDFWSLGVLVFEMCCGWSPFYHEDTQQMYKNIAFGKVRFPKDVLSVQGRNFLLNRNPAHRLGAQSDARELMKHPFFNDIDWRALREKRLSPPFKPVLESETDTSNFDPEFTSAPPHKFAMQQSIIAGCTPLSPGVQANFQGFTFVGESSFDNHFQKLRDSIDDEESIRRSLDEPSSITDSDEESPDAMSGVEEAVFRGDFEI